jgi:amylosucrase
MQRPFLESPGAHPGSFARGGVFQENEETGDRRNSGSFASLAGLEAAKGTGDRQQIELALHRMLMGYALICSFGGMPLLYMGDEIGLLNDYGFEQVPDHAHDNRWLHRPRMNWAVANAPSWPEQALLEGVKQIIRRRKSLPELHAAVPTQILTTGVPAIFSYLKKAERRPMVCLVNFSEGWTSVPAQLLRGLGISRFYDELGEAQIVLHNDAVPVAPYGRMWIV